LFRQCRPTRTTWPLVHFQEVEKIATLPPQVQRSPANPVYRGEALSRRNTEAEMSSIDETSTAAGNTVARSGDGTDADSLFRFLPRELARKCRKLIESYHATHGFGCLPDMLWQSDARDIIECHRELTWLFKTASKSRAAKRANHSLLLIATVIVSLEVLARDFARLGQALSQREAGGGADARRLSAAGRTWLMDLYLYPPLGIHRELVNMLAVSACQVGNKEELENSLRPWPASRSPSPSQV
jgi:hypothetical protein